MITNPEHTIAACKKGDRAAQKKLFMAFNQQLFAVSMKYMNDYSKAEEVLQESWIEIFNGLDKYQDQGKFWGWIKTIVIRKAWKHLSKNLHNVDIESVELPSIDYEKQFHDKMSCEEILALLDKLPNGPREIFKMYVIDGYTHDEIADILQISASTSRAHLSRARKLLINKIDMMNKVFTG